MGGVLGAGSGGYLPVWGWEEGSEGQLSIHSDLILTSSPSQLGDGGPNCLSKCLPLAPRKRWGIPPLGDGGGDVWQSSRGDHPLKSLGKLALLGGALA